MTHETPRPVDGPHPTYVRDARGIRYPGQLTPENLIWDLTTNSMAAFYSGEDIGAYRPTDIGHEVRTGDWAPEEFRGRFIANDGWTEQQAADLVLFNFNLYLRSQPADESGANR